MNSYLKTDLENGAIVVIIIALFLGVLTVGTHYITVPILKIERETLQNVTLAVGNTQNGEAIFGKVADYNIKINTYKELNKFPIIKWLIPESLANIKPIKIPNIQENFNKQLETIFNTI